MKRILAVLISGAALVGLGACSNDAQIASRNLSQMADNFGINRRIVFVNTLTDSYLLVVEGLCSQERDGRQLAVTCKVGDNEFKKHFLGLSDNVTYVSEQLEPARAGTYHYKVTFKPSAVIPSIDVR
jgi:hypothetical protein